MTSYQVVPGLGWPAVPAKGSQPVGWIGDVSAGSVSRETAEPAAGAPVQAAARAETSEDEVQPTAQQADPDSGGEDAVAEAEHCLAAAAGRLLERAARPEHTRVLVVANQKGGVGKTTTAVNIAAALAQQGQRVLLVDLDPQGNASTALSIPHPEGTPSSYDALIDSVPFSEIVAECPDVPGLLAVPATIDLAGAEIELVPLVARETRLRSALVRYLEQEEAAGRRVDYVFIDCPPSLGLLTVNALTAGDELLIPIQCEYYALEGLTHLLQTIDQVRLHLNPALRIAAIVLTMFDARTRLSAGVADEVRRHFGDKTLRTAVPRSVRIAEAPGYGQTVLTYDPGSAGALSYLEVAAELASQRVGVLS